MNGQKERPRPAGTGDTATIQSKRRDDTKIGRIHAELIRRSLNRFEAEHVGDHCLHSTVARLRSEGVLIVDQWETVAGRFGPVRVKRYRAAGRVA